MTTDGLTPPMHQQTASCPNHTEHCRDCGSLNGHLPPPGLGSPGPKPNGGKRLQTPSAAAASPVPDLNFPTLLDNRDQQGIKDQVTSPLVSRQTLHRILLQRRNGGDFPGDDGDDDDEDDDDD
eukprot:6480324-Amphidinium_carterae.1